MNRRRLLVGLGALIAAPAVIRTPGLLMPVRRIESEGGYIGIPAQWSPPKLRWVRIGDPSGRTYSSQQVASFHPRFGGDWRMVVVS